MQKKGSLILILVMTMINLVSAAYYGGGFSLGDLLNEIDSSTMLLGATFIISFALLNFALGRAFKDKHNEPNTAIAGSISFVFALGITWGINKTGFDFAGLFYDIGIPADFLFALLPLIILGAFVFMGIKWGIGKSLVFIGGFLIVTTFFVYEKETTVFLGILFIIAGAIVWWRWPKKDKNDYYNRDFRRRPSFIL